METKLARISQLSKENSDMVFTSLGHLINTKWFYEHLKHRIGYFGLSIEEEYNSGEDYQCMPDKLNKI